MFTLSRLNRPRGCRCNPRDSRYGIANPRALAQLRDALAAESELVIAFDDSIKGEQVRSLVAFGDSLGIPVRYCCLVDYSNSRGAMDMGLLPDLLPGYKPAQPVGMTAEEMIKAIDLDVLWVVGSNPLEGAPKSWRKAFIVVQEMFLTETAQLADVVLPAASAYEKNGTVTNVCGELQRLEEPLNTMGAKPDLEIMGLIGREMGLAKLLGPWFPEQVFEEIRANVKGYNIPLPVIETGGAAQTVPVNGPINVPSRPDLIHSAHDTLFTSGNLGKYSKILNSVLERRKSPVEPSTSNGSITANTRLCRHHPHQGGRSFGYLHDDARVSAVGRAQSDCARAGAHGAFARRSPWITAAAG